MKEIMLFAIASLGFGGTALAQSDVYVSGHVRNDGTYVPGHHRTAPNSTINDNWTTRPNVNPYNGRVGTRSPSYGGSTYGGSTYRPYQPYRRSR